MLDFNSDVKDQQLKVLQETIRNLQTQLLDNKMKETENQQKVADLEMRLKQANVKELLLKTKIVDATKNTTISSAISVVGSETDECDNDDIVCLDDDENEVPAEVTAEVPLSLEADATSTASHTKNIDDTEQQIPSRQLNTDEAHIICLAATFLVVHPLGAALDDIHSYIQCTMGNRSPLQPKELEDILRQHAAVFREKTKNATATSECQWKFCGFEQATTVVESSGNNNDAIESSEATTNVD